MKMAVGILLKDNQLHMVELAKERGEIRLSNSASEPTSGAGLQSAFSALLTKHRPASRDIVLGIGGSAAFVRTLQLLAMKGDRLEQAIRFELQQQTPFDISEVEWDWSPLAGQGAAATHRQILIAAVKKGLLEEPMMAAEAAGWHVASVTISSVGLYNCAAAARLLVGEGRAQLLVDIGQESSDLVLVRRGPEPVLWVRSVPIGLGQAASDVGELVEEIRRAVDVYRFQTAVSPDEVLLSGVGVSAEFLRDRLGAALQVAVRRLEPRERLASSAAAAPTSASATYAIACGLALQALGEAPLPINLLRRSRALVAAQRERLRYAIGVSVAAWLLVASTASASQRQIRERQLQIAQMDRLIELHRTLGPQLKRVEGQLTVLDERLGVLQDAVRRRTAALDLLAEIEQGMGPQTWLEQVTINNPLGRTAASEAVLIGKAPSYQVVNAWLNRLKASPMFVEVKPLASSVEPTSDGRGEVVSFTVSVRLAGGSWS